MSLLQTLIKPIGQKLITPKKEFPAGSVKLTPHKAAKKKCHITERQVEGLWVYDLTSKSSQHQSTRESKTGTEKLNEGIRGGKKGKTRKIYYFAGGAWQMPPSPEHWKLCAELNTKIPNSIVSVVSYPLAPNSPAEAAFPSLEKFYAAVMSETSSNQTRQAGEQDVEGEKASWSDEEDDIITFAGDSAGGNVALSLTIYMLTTYPQLRAPDSLLLVSPAVDLTPQDASNDPPLQETQKHDPLLSLPYTNSAADAWVGKMYSSDPRLTPLNAEISALASRRVKVYGITGGYDVLTPPALKFKEKCNEKGVEGEWLHWEGQMHCFPLAWVYGLKESKEGKDWILDVLRR